MMQNLPVPGPIIALRAGIFYLLRSSICVAALASIAAHAEFPKCQVRSGGMGAPAIVIDGKPVSPIFFSANNQFGRDEVLLQHLKLANDSGVELCTINIPLVNTADEIKQTLATFCSPNPQRKFLFRCWLGPPLSWLDEHPEARIKKADGTVLDMVSVTSSAWLEYVDENLERVLREIEAGPHAQQCIGIIPCYLQTGEWFFPETGEYMDYSTANVLAFRE